VSTGDQFKSAVERRDLEGVSALLAADIVFHSPVTFHPFIGRDTVIALLKLVSETFENFHYTDELRSPDAHALLFKAQVAGREIEGMDLLRYDSDGLIADFTVMLRPLSGLIPFAEAMGAKVAAAGLATTHA
jgi:hypothetical protein